ncbi:MAG: hypothetical protein IBX50_17190 [Marinospirillum sp.]|uniref:hypothetical protein n=1 Tax=Marinospirillum sp. TaxID=2183934 RepID=UPI0019EA03B5|nr:hypothetical protein [Marinospirillum sp.]MBE0508427.1 hypothetical protein [Marinospirillum sp.]
MSKKTLRATLEVEIPDVEVTYEQLQNFVWFYICHEGSIKTENPLYGADYEITYCDFEQV